MKKKQKIYLALLLVAAAAFVLDQMTHDPDDLGSTQATAALRARSRPSQGPKGKLQAASLVSEADLDMLKGPGLAGLLEETCRLDVQTIPLTRDVFQPSQVYKPKEDENKQEQGPAKPSAEEMAIKKLASTYKLKAVLSGKNGAAILNERCVSVGDVLDDCTLTEVSGNKAVFQAGSFKVVFFLEN